MKKIALINPDSNFLIHDGDRPCLNLSYLANEIRKKHEVRIFDFAIENGEELLKQISEYKPEIIGFTATTPIFSQAVNILNKIKEIVDFNFISVIGGIQATIMPEFCLKYFNYVITGEADFSFAKFCDEELLLLLSGKNGNNRIVKSNFISDINGLEPSRDLLPMDKYYMKLDNELCTPIITSRGCPYGCVYCSSILGNKVRLNSAENVVNEIFDIMEEYDINSFYFLDDVFTYDKKRVFDICDLIKKMELNITFRATTRINLVDKGVLEALKEAGCHLICYGLESGSDKILQAYNKRFTVQDIKNVVGMTKNVGIPIKAFWMTSFLEENDDKKATQDLIQELDLKENDIYELTIYPGSKLWRGLHDDRQDFELTYFDKFYHGGKLMKLKKEGL